MFPPSPRLAAVAVAALLALPRASRAADAELVAEALFLPDALPPNELALVVSTALRQGEPDVPGGAAPLLAPARLQVAVPLGERLGFTADVALSDGRAVGLSAPAASLKLLLRSAEEPGTTGLAASLDALAVGGFGDAELLLGLGAVRAAGRITFRAAGVFGSTVGAFTPHLQAGGSAAVALGTCRALLELVGDITHGRANLSVGSSFKWALGPRTAVMVGALFPLDGSTPLGAAQLSKSL